MATRKTTKAIKHWYFALMKDGQIVRQKGSGPFKDRFTADGKTLIESGQVKAEACYNEWLKGQDGKGKPSGTPMVMADTVIEAIKVTGEMSLTDGEAMAKKIEQQGEQIKQLLAAQGIKEKPAPAPAPDSSSLIDPADDDDDDDDDDDENDDDEVKANNND